MCNMNELHLCNVVDSTHAKPGPIPISPGLRAGRDAACLGEPATDDDVLFSPEPLPDLLLHVLCQVGALGLLNLFLNNFLINSLP